MASAPSRTFHCAVNCGTRGLRQSQMPIATGATSTKHSSTSGRCAVIGFASRKHIPEREQCPQHNRYFSFTLRSQMAIEWVEGASVVTVCPRRTNATAADGIARRERRAASDARYVMMLSWLVCHVLPPSYQTARDGVLCFGQDCGPCHTKSKHSA